MKFEKEIIHIDSMEIYKHTRSPFANIKFSGCGAHSTDKDYKRNKVKQKDKKEFKNYTNHRGSFKDFDRE